MISCDIKTGRPVSPRRDVDVSNLVLCRFSGMSDAALQALLMIKERLVLGVFAMISSICLTSFSPAFAGGGDGTFLVAKHAISAPAGASGLCAKYRWACAPSGQSRISQSDLIPLATAINTKVNRQTRTVADQSQYGREEYWTLPTARGGDCEDFVLLKKKTLIEHGVASKNLLIATVLDRSLNSHAVLVLRTPKGDLILDNLNRDIRPWKKTGYTFLKLQNPASPGGWHAVLAGGVIQDSATGTR